MNTKIIIAIITFFTTFGFSSAVTRFIVGVPTTPSAAFTKRNDWEARRKILRLLEQDIRNGQERFGELSGLENLRQPFSEPSLSVYAEIINDYADKSGRMSDEDLPRDFQRAWRKHMRAWRERADFLNDLKNSAAKQDLPACELYRMHNKQGVAINQTWYEVLRIAAAYGAFPENAY